MLPIFQWIHLLKETVYNFVDIFSTSCCCGFFSFAHFSSFCVDAALFFVSCSSAFFEEESPDFTKWRVLKGKGRMMGDMRLRMRGKGGNEGEKEEGWVRMGGDVRTQG